MTTFKVKFNSFDPREDWLADQGILHRVEFDWKTSELTFQDADDATAYSLRFNETPITS